MSEVIFYTEHDVVSGLSKVQKAILSAMVDLLPDDKKGDSKAIVTDIESQIAEKKTAMQTALTAGDLDKLGSLLAESNDLESNKKDSELVATVKAILDTLPDDSKAKGRGKVSKESVENWGTHVKATTTSMLKSEWRKAHGLTAAYAPALVRSQVLTLPEWSDLKDAVKGIPTDASITNTVTVWKYDGQTFAPIESLGQHTSPSSTMKAYSTKLGGSTNPGNKQSAWADQPNMNIENVFKQWAQAKIAPEPAPKKKA